MRFNDKVAKQPSVDLFKNVIQLQLSYIQYFLLDIVFGKLVAAFVVWMKESPLWCRICSKLIISVPDNQIEYVIVGLTKISER